jgi:conjugal transfer pilus assembly protein TraW
MKIRVYFDQGGALVRKFGISQVPAIVSQEGRMLKVNEVKVN